MAYLVSCGWAIEAHRFKLRPGGGPIVAFVEVKTRASAAWGQPAESVLWRKRRTIVRVAEVWCERHGRVGDTYRFDVIEVRVGAAHAGGAPRGCLAGS